MFNKYFLRTTVLYGSVAGILCFVYCLALNALGIIPLSGKLFPSNIFILVAVFQAVKTYRKHNPDMTMHFWEGLSVSMLTAIIASVVIAVILYIFYSSDYGHNLIAQFVEQALKEYIGAKAQIVKETNLDYFNSLIAGIKAIDPSSIAWTEIKQRPLIAILPSIMISLYYRRQYIN
ncbi:DUF4199 domain-containing protein [Flectobacillus major]|jgi:ABC-type uncharacterized transport system permease subunit|uniref:DUF4199 domain-containing protein n=1 Tax=Flectobacillus major TaxID=103 RepID=UPI00040A60FC|nr:DUF4199 domain-containing protein [Flectobacillus major]